jgi:hypothetical protein
MVQSVSAGAVGGLLLFCFAQGFAFIVVPNVLDDLVDALWSTGTIIERCLPAFTVVDKNDNKYDNCSKTRYG